MSQEVSHCSYWAGFVSACCNDNFDTVAKGIGFGGWKVDSHIGEVIADPDRAFSEEPTSEICTKVAVCLLVNELPDSEESGKCEGECCYQGVIFV